MSRRKAPPARTPGPWLVRKGGNFTQIANAAQLAMCERDSYSGWVICQMQDWNGVEHDSQSPRVAADAAFIVKACNAHDDLVSVLRALKKCKGVHTTDQASGETFYDLITGALAQAGE